MERMPNAHPDVTFSGEESLRDAGCVQTGAGDVKRRHEKQPAHLTNSRCFDQTFADDKVQSRNHTAQSQTHKHTWERREPIIKWIWVFILSSFQDYCV